MIVPDAKSRASGSSSSAAIHNGSNVRQAAEVYFQQGYAVLPIPFRSKNPGFANWQKFRITYEEIPHYFNGGQQNIGVLLGEPSGGIVDIDLDHPRCVSLADRFLPATPAVFGRSGKLRSHRLFRVTGSMPSRKFRSKSAGTLVEVRSTGLQTVFPPSVHTSGEPIEWEQPEAVPSETDPDSLLEAVARLANAVKIELGEKTTSVAKLRQSSSNPPQSVAPPLSPHEVVTGDRSIRCKIALRRIGIVDQRDGSHRLFACACRAVEYDLDDASALAVIHDYARERPFPRVWSDDEILRRVRDAEKHCQRGLALRTETDGCVPFGSRDPLTGRLVLSPKRTLPTASAYINDFHLHPAGRTLVNCAGVLMEWQGNRYVEVEEQAVKKRLQLWLHQAVRYTRNYRTNELKLVDFESNSASIKGALEAIQAYVHIPSSTLSPSWLVPLPDDTPPRELLACRSSLLHLPTMTSYPPTPRLFNVNALEFDPDPEAPPPKAWHDFLHQLFDGDIESLDLLREWFGYCLTGDTSQQKMLLVIGPKRSGKGTIARVLTRLIGIGNVAGPTISSLAGPFGLQPLLGKSLAIVSDARFHGESVPTVVERLLCISGEDAITVDRKHLTSVTAKLPTRFMFLTNEFPRFTDASGALAGRFVILRLTKSFYGREDKTLTDRLAAELPGILNWSIEGWKRLRERGRFVMPPTAHEVMQAIDELASPVTAFTRECCVVGPGYRVNVDALYDAWKHWCESEGRQAISTKQSFGRDLSAAITGIIRRRGTGQLPFYEGLGLKGFA